METETDVLVVGGGLGGVAGALAASRLGRRVVLTEETDWIGGQLTAQAVPPDEHPWIEEMGCTASYRRLRNGIRDFYRKNYPLTAGARDRDHLNPGDRLVSRLCHEPRVALAVLEGMLAPYRSGRRLLLVLRCHRPVAAESEQDLITAITLLDEETGEMSTVHARYVLDATEFGDLLELAGVEHTVGAESQDETGEPHALPGDPDPLDQQAVGWCFPLDYMPGEDHTMDKPQDYDFWRGYRASFWPGQQLSWTDVYSDTLQPRHRAIIHEEPFFVGRDVSDLWHYRRILARENFSEGLLDSDIILVNWPQIDYWLGPLVGVGEEERHKHLQLARHLSLSMLYWMQTEAPRLDGGAGYRGLRLRHDVVGSSDGLARHIYVRESRRIRAEFTVLEQHVGVEARGGSRGAEYFHDSVGIGAYRIDLHPSAAGRSYVDVSSWPFQIPLGALIPVRLRNLLPACKNLGTTHITNGCYRLHPVEWNVGEASGALAAYYLAKDLLPRQVREDVASLEEQKGDKTLIQPPRPEYPRPQLRRRDWTNLNGDWSFAFDDSDAGLASGWQNTDVATLRSDQSPFDRRITVPFCYQSKLSGIGERAFHDVVWYARTFEYTPSGDERLLLHFGAVDYRATVWVNGTQVISHEGGHTPFSTDVTHALAGEARDNIVVVRAEDPSRDVTIPRGKQYWKEKSEGIFYTRTTGIWQTVWLEPVNRSRIDSLRLTPNVDAASVEVEVPIEGIEPGMNLRATVELDGEQVLEDTISVRSSLVERSLPLLRRGEAPDTPHLADWPGPALWSPEHPSLYDLRLELLDPDGEVLDRVESYFGMRKIEVKDGRVLLNDRPLYQRLVLDQGYFPEGILTAPTDEDLRRDVELAKEMGFNGARKHQKVEDPRWLFWADTLGFLVWGEMANAYQYSPDYVRRMTAEWQEAVMRDYNHPCIIAWVPMNESWGVPNLASDRSQTEHLLALYHLTRSLDPTRPVVSNDGWEHAITDLCNIHDYRDAEALARSYTTPESSVAAEPANRSVYVPGYAYRGEPILITEFGGIAFSGDASGEGWGYSTVADAEEFLAHYQSLIEALLQSELVQGFCYTQLTDVEQEVNGLLAYDRTPKADLAHIKDITASLKP